MLYEVITLIKGSVAYRQYATQIMEGKKIEFNPDTFKWIVDKVYASEMEMQQVDPVQNSLKNDRNNFV